MFLHTKNQSFTVFVLINSFYALKQTKSGGVSVGENYKGDHWKTQAKPGCVSYKVL